MVPIGMWLAMSSAKSQVPRSTASATSRLVFSRTRSAMRSRARGENAVSMIFRSSRWRWPSVTASIWPAAESPPASRVTSRFPRSDVKCTLSR